MKKPELHEPCPASSTGKHSLYAGGPGGKQDRKKDWQVCQSCGANGPLSMSEIDLPSPKILK